MKNAYIFALTIIFCLTFCFTSSAQTNLNENGDGIVFKIPKKVMPIQWASFKGLLMLDQKRPTGIFISYPNDGESLESLTKRAEISIAKMFVHDEKKSEGIVWQIKSIPAHSGDKGENATMKFWEDETQSIQITFYEREWNNLKLIYGYFARKSKTSKDKDDSGDFLDDKGQGSKTFDEFWKSFSSKQNQTKKSEA